MTSSLIQHREGRGHETVFPRRIGCRHNGLQRRRHRIGPRPGYRPISRRPGRPPHTSKPSCRPRSGAELWFQPLPNQPWPSKGCQNPSVAPPRCGEKSPDQHHAPTPLAATLGLAPMAPCARLIGCRHCRWRSRNARRWPSAAQCAASSWPQVAPRVGEFSRFSTWLR